MARRSLSPSDRRYEADMRIGWKLMAATFQLLAEVAALLLIGYAVDWWLGTSPRWTAVGGLIGIVYGLVNFVRTAIRLQGGWSPASTPPPSPGGPDGHGSRHPRRAHERGDVPDDADLP